jgi:ADP-ribose pyrophosphatase YjhB (NUDIX family)
MVSFFYKYKKLRVRVAALLKNAAGEILLVKQRKNKKDYWLLPGGGIEFGESAVDALARELKEEINVEIENPIFLLLNENIDPKGQKHLIQLIFGANIKKGMEPSISQKEENILELKYFSTSELENIEIRPDIKSYLLSHSELTPSAYIKSKWITE